MRIGYFDCFSGISGDMTLGALADAGVDPRAIQSAVASLGLPCELAFETVRRGGFRANYAKVIAPPEHAQVVAIAAPTRAGSVYEARAPPTELT